MSTITVCENENTALLTAPFGVSLLSVLRDAGYSVSAPCGGRGTCGNCRVRIRDALGERTVTACGYYPEEDCAVFLSSRPADLSWNEITGAPLPPSGKTGFGAAVDLGTTTVALALFRLDTAEALGTRSDWNAQKAYGADVITRISRCMEQADGLETLSRAVREQVAAMLRTLCAEKDVPLSEVREIFLAGNTVMQHIFAGLSPDSIAAAPFRPLSLFDGDEIFSLEGVPLRYSPCVAGYVGGDITAGLLASGLPESEELCLFLDVGTNGEMALGSARGILTCAVASGPAFEGAGISCGMPAAPHAVNRVFLTEEGLSFEVIGGGEAQGLCGSGLLDLAACLLELGVLDETGCLEEDEEGEAVFHLTDRVFLTQKDVRRLQLAKAAVAAGIRRLLQEEGVSFGDVRRMYLAGGFGNRLSPESAVRIGMLPAELAEKTVPLGNACLAGVTEALFREESASRLREIASRCRYIELSGDAAFNELYIEELYFPEDEA